MTNHFIEQTEPLLSVSLAFITFSIGGSLTVSKLKVSGKKVLFLTVSESLAAFIFVFFFMYFSLSFFIHLFNSAHTILAISLVLASLAAPTDPSATLAVIHEYKATGEVSSAMLEIAAFDDIIGIIIYTVVTAFATSYLGNSGIEFTEIFLDLGSGIGGAVLLGGIMGVLFNFMIKIFKFPFI